MELVKYVLEYDGRVTVNHEYSADVKRASPLVLEWFRGFLPDFDPAPVKTIKIKRDLYIIQDRKKTTEPEIQKVKNASIEKLSSVLGHVKITPDGADPYIAIGTAEAPTLTELPFAFLQCVSFGDFENALAMLDFAIGADQFREYCKTEFGIDFEVLINNYLESSGTDTEQIVSILPKDSVTAKSFNFKLEKNKISNISSVLFD